MFFKFDSFYYFEAISEYSEYHSKLQELVNNYRNESDDVACLSTVNDLASLNTFLHNKIESNVASVVLYKLGAADVLSPIIKYLIKVLWKSTIENTEDGTTPNSKYSTKVAIQLHYYFLDILELFASIIQGHHVVTVLTLNNLIPTLLNNIEIMILKYNSPVVNIPKVFALPACCSFLSLLSMFGEYSDGRSVLACTSERRIQLFAIVMNILKLKPFPNILKADKLVINFRGTVWKVASKASSLLCNVLLDSSAKVEMNKLVLECKNNGEKFESIFKLWFEPDETNLKVTDILVLEKLEPKDLLKILERSEFKAVDTTGTQDAILHAMTNVS